MDHRPHLLANLCGFLAIALWGSLALFTTLTGTIPPFQLTAMTFSIGGIAAFIIVALRGRLSDMIQPPLVWAHGVIGLFAFHALYFIALRYAPAAEANLINYLWPLLIVLFSAFLPGEKLLKQHIIGALIGFSGLLVLVLFGKGLSGGLSGPVLIGYGAALGCAFGWSIYSVIARLFTNVLTDAVTGFCIATAILAALVHLGFETTIWPQTPLEWLFVAALGLGPVAGSLFLWDYAMKNGNVQILGASAYFTPLISTALLVLFGKAEAAWYIGLAALLILAGALISSWDVIRRLVLSR